MMLSTDVRLRVEFICKRIEGGHDVSLEAMQWVQKWADHHRTVASMLRTARRRAINGLPEKGTIDELIDGLDLGEPDPSSHLIGPQDPTTLAAWFKPPKWLQND